MIALSSTARMVAALRSAHRIAFSAYFLHPGVVVSALEEAGRRGARVSVRVEAEPFGATSRMRSDTRQALEELKAAGVDARPVRRKSPDAPGFHLKAAVCDGVAYLDDCNWNNADTVVRDEDRVHVRAIREAVLGCGPKHAGTLALDKDVALRDETRVLVHAKRAVSVETETIGVSVVSGELRRLAKAGVRCRLLVSERNAKKADEHKRIQSLERDGVKVRAIGVSEKLAVAGDSAWVGSANATFAWGKYDFIDWGIATADPAIVRALDARFNEHWRAAQPVSS